MIQIDLQKLFPKKSHPVTKLERIKHWREPIQYLIYRFSQDKMNFEAQAPFKKAGEELLIYGPTEINFLGFDEDGIYEEGTLEFTLYQIISELLQIYAGVTLDQRIRAKQMAVENIRKALDEFIVSKVNAKPTVNFPKRKVN